MGAYRSGDGWGSRVENDFFTLKGVAEALLARLGIDNAGYVPLRHPVFHPLRAAAILLDHHPEALGRRPIHESQVVGGLGEVDRDVREAFELEQRCYALLLDFDRLLAHAAAARTSQPTPRYPPVIQDVALVVGQEVPAEHVEAVIRRAGGDLVAALRLFDVYEGDRIPAGKRSLAYSISYQAPDRTLTDAEVASVQRRIVSALERQLGAHLRGG
jgi:phenylalanyl-tRNA synthetase beta chain